MSDEARNFVMQAKELPVMPPVAAEIIRKAENPDTQVSTLIQLISRDAALAVRVLKIANSSFYSSARKIETLQQAIVLLGYSTLRSIVVAASLRDVFSRFGLSERLLWEHSVAAAIGATSLAEGLQGVSREEAFVGGLVHDIGKLLMHFQAEKQYQEVMRAVYSEEQSPMEAEIEILGFDHMEVGALVLEKWRLPERLVAAVGAHHNPEELEEPPGAQALAALLQVADAMCLHQGFGRRKPDTELNPLDCEGARILGLDSQELDGLLEAFRTAYDAEKEVFA
jgi:putative nucleotidyltransferase with HDIG domain